VEVRTSSGDVRGDRLSGRVITETISGDVDVTGPMALLRVTTVSGDVLARGVRGEIEVRTTSGELQLDGERVTRLIAESMSGDLVFDGTLSDDAQLRINTHSGDVTVYLPASAKGRLELSTVNGELDTGGPMTMMPGLAPSSGRGRNARRYEFNGGGLLQLDISTFSGDVRMRRGIRS
jgi:DUF4097 and DUF4098 domain-containing protein YvlB